MRAHIAPALRLSLALIAVFVILYSLIVWAIAQLAPNAGKGELIRQNGRTYYANIGQSFTDDRYFYSRPSAVGYNAAGSAGSNKGPSNPDYLALVQARLDTFLVHNPGVTRRQVPADLLTASASGLDPHISVAGAEVQIARIARLRGLEVARLRELVEASTEGPLLGFLGPRRVHVLKLNLALDGL